MIIADDTLWHGTNITHGFVYTPIVYNDANVDGINNTMTFEIIKSSKQCVSSFSATRTRGFTSRSFLDQTTVFVSAISLGIRYVPSIIVLLNSPLCFSAAEIGLASG